MNRYFFSTIFLFFFTIHTLAVDTQVLADSLQARYVPFSEVWSPKVKVKQVRVNGNNVTVRTNGVLGGVVFTPSELVALRKQVSLWVL